MGERPKGIGGNHVESMNASGACGSSATQQSLWRKGYAARQGAIQSVCNVLRNTLGDNLETVVIAHGKAGAVGAGKVWRSIGWAYRTIAAETIHGFLRKVGVISFVISVIGGFQNSGIRYFRISNIAIGGVDNPCGSRVAIKKRYRPNIGQVSVWVIIGGGCKYYFVIGY